MNLKDNNGPSRPTRIDPPGSAAPEHSPAAEPTHTARHIGRSTAPLWWTAVALLVLALPVAGAALLCSGPKKPTCTILQAAVPGVDGGSSIPVTITLPQDAAGPMPLVAMCHGFTGNRGGDGHFEPIARALAAEGVASAALDFPASGERSGEPFTEYTLQHMQRDLGTVLTYMQQTYNIDTASIGLLGHSMGGRLVTSCLPEGVLPLPVAAAALWSPANGDGVRGLEFLASPQPDDAARMQELEALYETARGQGSVATRWGVEVSCDLFDQLAANPPAEDLLQYRGALMLSYAPAADLTLFSAQTIDATRTAAVQRGLPCYDYTDDFADATHNYDAPDDPQKDAAIRANIERLTVEFFLRSFGLAG